MTVVQPTYWAVDADGKVVCAWCGFEPNEFSHHKCRLYLDGSSPGLETGRYLEARENEREYWQQLEELQGAIAVTLEG